MANILAPTELDADDSIFHNLSSTYTSFPSYSESKSSDALNNEEAEKYNNIENESDSKNDYSQKDNLASPLMPRRFDFEDLLTDNTKHTELMSRPQSLPLEAESTGRVPVVAVSYTHLTLPTIAAECRSRWSPYH